MKRTLLVLAVLALASACVLSCKKKTDEPAVKEEPAQLTQPEKTADAVSIVFADVQRDNNGNAVITEEAKKKAILIDDHRVLPEKIIFTETGNYIFKGIIVEVPTPKAGIGDVFLKVGQYIKQILNGKMTFQMPGIGSITVPTLPSHEGASQNAPAEVAPEQGDIVTYDTTVTDAPAVSGENESNMVRDWVPEGKVKVVVPSKDIKTNVEPSLEAVAQYLKEHEINVNVAAYAGYDIDFISLSMADMSFTVVFKNNKSYLGNWSWKNKDAGEFAYDFSSDIGGELISGSANGTVSFYSENNVNKCHFNMGFSAKGYDGTLEFILKEKK